MTQNEAVLIFMAKHGSITARDAVMELGIYRLAARIADLKELGYPIKTIMRHDENGRRWAEYGLRYS